MRDLWRPGGGRSGLTWRRLGVLVRHLPPESATMTALRNASPGRLADGDPAEGRWSQAEVLQAATLDAVQNLAWLYACAHAEKGKTPKKPDPTPRPGTAQADRPQRMPLEAYERLFAHINGLPGGPELKLVPGGKQRG